MHYSRPCVVMCAVLAAFLAIGAAPVRLVLVAAVEAGEASEAGAELERGRQLRTQENYEEAIATFRRGLARKPERAVASELLFEVGQTRYKQGKSLLDGGSPEREATPILTEALATFASVLETYPESNRAAAASHMSGSTLMLLDQPERALKAYQTTFDRYPDYEGRSGSLVRAGVVLAGLDRIPDGIAALQRVVREFPDRKGDVETARKYISQLEITGRRFTPLRAQAWLNNLVDDSDLASFDGEVVVLVFLATWCSSCTDEIPHLRRLITTWSDKGVVFLGALDPKDPMNTEAVDVYVAKADLDFLDVGLVENPEAWSAYQTDRLPAAVIIDRRGIIRWRGHPALFPRYLVTKLLGR